MPGATPGTVPGTLSPAGLSYLTMVANRHEAKTQLSRLVERALAGEEVLIARAGTPLVRLQPVSPGRVRRQPGALRGRVVIHEEPSA